MILEAVPSFFTFPERRFLLTVVKGQGAQILGHPRGTADGDVADGIMLEITPNAETVTEIGGDIDVGVGDKGLRGESKILRSVV